MAKRRSTTNGGQKETVIPEWFQSDRQMYTYFVRVRICVFRNGEYEFSTQLTRVPVPGEEIYEGNRLYRVLNVQHNRIDYQGRMMAGYHAYVDVVQIVEEEPEIWKPRKRRKRTR